VKDAGWETVLNRAGMTFRNLPEKEKHGLSVTADRVLTVYQAGKQRKALHTDEAAPA
jgi:hypothetical protein